MERGNSEYRVSEANNNINSVTGTVQMLYLLKSFTDNSHQNPLRWILLITPVFIGGNCMIYRDKETKKLHDIQRQRDKERLRN